MEGSIKLTFDIEKEVLRYKNDYVIKYLTEAIHKEIQLLTPKIIVHIGNFDTIDVEYINEYTEKIKTLLNELDNYKKKEYPYLFTR